jgi:hypothetical protein
MKLRKGDRKGDRYLLGEKRGKGDRYLFMRRIGIQADSNGDGFKAVVIGDIRVPVFCSGRLRSGSGG